MDKTSADRQDILYEGLNELESILHEGKGERAFHLQPHLRIFESCERILYNLTLDRVVRFFQKCEYSLVQFVM